MAAPTESKVEHGQSPSKKRKKDSDDTPLPAKAQKKDEFKEIEFKFLLRNSSTLFSGLEKFVEVAESYTEDQYDLVDGYCLSSPECTEILQVLEGGRRKMQELQLVFGCLEKILLRIADDLNAKYFSCGMTIVKKLISSHMGQIYFGLNSTNKASQIKTTLKLLVAMVMLGPATTKIVINNMDFNHTYISNLFRWRDSKDDEDVRTCIIHLIIGLLLNADNESLRRLADVKGLFPHVFNGLMYDQVSLIQLLLSTVLEKIIMNPSVSKTSKVNMFQDETLRQLTLLFRWQGPQHWKNMLGSKRGQKPAPDVETMELDEDEAEQRALVANIVHSFLIELCSSHKHGIVFMDKSYGQSGRNQNHLLTSVMSYLISGARTQTLVQDLVAKILVACPDQVTHFCQASANSLSPRAEKKWVDSVNFILKVYDSLPREPYILKMKEHRSVSDLVSILLLYTLPTSQVIRTVTPGLKDKSLAVNHVTLGVIKMITERAAAMIDTMKGILATDRVRAMYTSTECKDIIAQYREKIITSLPNALTLFMFWDKQQQEAGDVTDVAQKEQLADLCQTDIDGVKVRTLQVFCLYQQLSPGLLMDHPVGLGKLLDGIVHKQTVVDGEEKEEISQVSQLYLLKLLATTESRRLPWSRKSSSGQTLIYQLLEMVTMATGQPHTEHVTRQLMCKLLEGTGLFENFGDELLSWLKHVQLVGHSAETRTQVLDFVAQVIVTYIHNPHPYMERVGDLRSEVMLTQSGQEGGGQSLTQKIEEILSKDIGSLTDEETNTSSSVSARLPFCPMLLVAVDQLKKMENIPEEVTLYISAVLLDTFHLQQDPQPLVAMVTDCQKSMFTDGLCNYVNLWKTHDKEVQTSTQWETLTKTGELSTVKKLSKVMSSLPQYDADPGPCDVIRQYLQHLTYLTLGMDTKTSIVAMTRLTSMLKDKVTHIIDADDDAVVEKLPEEFALLDSVKETQLDVQRTAIQLILDHPTVRQMFMKQPELGSGWLIVTELVVDLLDKVRQSALKPELVDFYQARVLDCLKSVAATFNETLPGLVFRSLENLVPCIDADKCVGVLETVMVAMTTDSNDSIYIVVSKLLEKLISSDLRTISISASTCESAINNLEKLNHVTAFFKRFANLAVLCSSKVVGKVMSSPEYNDLAVVLMQMNGQICEDVGDRLTAAPRESLLALMPLVVTYLNSSSNQEGVQHVSGHVIKLVKQDLLDICTSTDPPSTTLLHFCKVSVQKGHLGKTLTAKMEASIFEALKSDRKLFPHQVELLDLLVGCHGNRDAGHCKMVQLCMECLMRCLGDKQRRGQGMEEKIMDILSQCTQDNLEKVMAGWDQITDLWPKFVKTTLKHMYTDKRLLSFLGSIVQKVYTEDADIQLPVDTFVTMVMSHTSFIPIMFNKENSSCKGPLLNLLLELIELSPMSCEADHVRIFLGAYGATLSQTDQQLLKLLQIYERDGVTFTDFKPYLWGDKAIEHHTLYKSLGPGLLKVPNMSTVISNIDRARIHKSTLLFPLRRKLQGTTVEDAVEYKSSDECYDPRFMLPLFSHLLSHDSIVDCRKFVDQGCFGYTVAALSSHDEAVRSAACHILASFRGHLDTARFMEKDQFIYLLSLLQDSLAKPKVKLASIMTQFLARTASLLLKPVDHMYGMINSFLLLKPSLDVLNVPEFYKLFNSSALQHKTERAWILSLMLEGMRETADFRIYEKRYAFKLLQSFYDSESSDVDSQVKILQIIETACRVRSVAMEMTKDTNLPIWILLSVNKLNNRHRRTQLLPQLVCLIHTLWFSMLGKGEYQREATTEVVLKTAFTTQVLSALQACLWHLRDSTEDVLLTLSETLLSVLDYIEERSSKFRDADGKIPEVQQTILYVDVLLLLLNSQKHVPSTVSSHSILRLLAAFRFDTSSLSQTKEEDTAQRKLDDNKADADDDVQAVAKQSGDASELDAKTEGEGDVEDENSSSKCSVLRSNIMKLVLKWSPNIVENRVEECVGASLTVMVWIVQQMELIDDVKLVSQSLQWLHGSITDDNFKGRDMLVQILASAKLTSATSKTTSSSAAAAAELSSCLSVDIVTGLMAVYSNLNRPAGAAEINLSAEKLKMKQYATEHLNKTFTAVMEAMFGFSMQQVAVVKDSRLLDTDRKSLSLRCLFLSKCLGDTDKVSPTSEASKSKKQTPSSSKKDKKRKSLNKSLSNLDSSVTMADVTMADECLAGVLKERTPKRQRSAAGAASSGKKQKRKSKGTS